MTRSKLDSLNCSVAHSLALIGERWTILIIREAFFETRRFEEFQRHLGIARNILAARLGKLCDSGILERVPVKKGARRQEYRLKYMGRDLLPVLVALTQWGDRWILGPEAAPIKVCAKGNGRRNRRCDDQGQRWTLAHGARHSVGRGSGCYAGNAGTFAGAT